MYDFLRELVTLTKIIPVMKYIKILCLMLILPIFSIAQKHEKLTPDSIIHESALGEVSDTLNNENIFDLEAPLKITLKYDITSFIKNKHKAEYIDAELQILSETNEPVIKNIRIQARGNFRKGQCYFPPLSLNFKTDSIKRTELAGTKKIKVVTHCTTGKNNDNIVLREYLVYKLYNILTEKSFRVKLLDITYIDTGKKKLEFQETGFIIEPADLVAKRNNSILIDPMVVKGANLVEEDADRAAMFQYMISNTDWRIKSGHNTKYMKSMTDVTPKVIPVPYDFDFSAVVDAPYAFPQEWSDAETLYQRNYLGYCRNDESEYLKIISLFLEKENQVMSYIKDIKYLGEKDKKYVSEYISEFYSEIKDQKSFLNKIRYQCRSIDF